MLAGKAFEAARKRWLKVLHWKEPFDSIDDWVDANDMLKSRSSELWWELQEDAGALSEAYGIAPWQVTWALFVNGFDPSDPESPGFQFPLDSWQPQARLRPPPLPKKALDILTNLGAQTGILVTFEVRVDADDAPDPPGPRDFRVVMEIPVECPPDLAVRDMCEVLKVSRDSVRQAGVDVPHRIRWPSPISDVTFCLVSHNSTAEFIERLQSAASGSTVGFRVEPGQPSAASSENPNKTALSLTRLEVVFPLDVNSNELAKALREGMKTTRSILSEAGLILGDHLRHAPLTRLSPKLKVDGQVVPARGLGVLAEDEFGAPPQWEYGPTPEKTEIIAQLKSQRNQVKERVRKKGLLET